MHAPHLNLHLWTVYQITKEKLQMSGESNDGFRRTEEYLHSINPITQQYPNGNGRPNGQSALCVPATQIARTQTNPKEEKKTPDVVLVA